MPTITSMVVNDGVADTTFTTDSITNTHVLLQDVSESVMDARKLLHFDRPAARGKGPDRNTIRINCPAPRVVSGITTYVQSSGRAEFIFDSSATVAERKAVLISLANACLHASTQLVVTNREWVY